MKFLLTVLASLAAGHFPGRTDASTCGIATRQSMIAACHGGEQLNIQNEAEVAHIDFTCIQTHVGRVQPSHNHRR